MIPIPILHALGMILILLALMHLFIPARFKWKEDTRGCSLLTRQILYIHTFFIGLMVGLMGLLCLSSAELLTTTPLGRRLAAGLAFFWGCRFVLQFFGYSSQHWKGKPFETFVHISFSLLWFALTATFASIALNSPAPF